MSPWISLDRNPARCSALLSSRTVVLRFEKTIAVLTSSARSNSVSLSRFFDADTGTSHCLMLTLAVAGRATSIVLGFDRNLSASFLIGGGIVAENSSVWRLAGNLV